MAVVYDGFGRDEVIPAPNFLHLPFALAMVFLLAPLRVRLRISCHPLNGPIETPIKLDFLLALRLPCGPPRRLSCR